MVLFSCCEQKAAKMIKWRLHKSLLNERIRLMEHIRFEEMPRSAQEAYLKKAKNRKTLLFVEWAIAAVTYVMTFIGAILNGENPIVLTFGALAIALLFSGFICGLDHLGFLFKKSVKHGIGLIIILGIWYIALFSAITMLAYFIGWIFLIIDSILFFTKKPLVYRSEQKRFLQTEQAQAEILAQAIGELNSPSAADKLDELK